MRKPWSISTTVRNPERIRDFLKILKLLENQKWTRETQNKFQVLLIQYKVYGYGNQQFYNSLSKKHLKLMSTSSPIKFPEAEEILDAKKYTGGGDMRGRQSFNPLEKMGLAFIDNDNKVRISAVGNYFLEEDYDLGDVFLKSFLKWQLPNPDSRDFKKKDGFNIKPFVATLHLISRVNDKWSRLGNKPTGISKKEFSIFVPTLINYSDIEEVAQKVINLRLELQRTKKNRRKYSKEYIRKHIKEFLGSDDNGLINSTSRNVTEYTDNIIRYFRLTRYIYIRGGGYWVDLESRRSIEIDSLLKTDSGKAIDFKTRKDYISYLSDIKQPLLPWDTSEKLKEIVAGIIDEIKRLESILNISGFKEESYAEFTKDDLKEYIEKLRRIRRNLQEEINYKKSQDLINVKEYIRILKNEIYDMDNRPLILEKYITLALNALNDALEIKPNYPVGDDNEPTNTAPAGEPDIECFYKTFNSICEVTMLKNRSQWFNEGQPVMRHLRNFEENNPKKGTYCLFVAPILHIDTIETFWYSIKHGYRGKRQKIVPLSIKQFVELLEVLIDIKERKKPFSHKSLLMLYESILDISRIPDSDIWIKSIPQKIKNWKEEVLA